jgi:hypothetical protein
MAAAFGADGMAAVNTLTSQKKIFVEIELCTADYDYSCTYGYV